MLRRLLDYPLSLAEKGGPLYKIRPFVTANDTLLYEPPNITTLGPHIRDAVDLKRWMFLVVISLLPCIVMAIWNTGIQSFIYSSGDPKLIEEFLDSSSSWDKYSTFINKDFRYLTVLKLGFYAFIPIVIITYMTGGLCEGIFACIKKKDITEGFLVTGILYALILPPTIPYWMAALGIAVGIILGKEMFGGTGFNIVNPALTCRAFLFFAFPSYMSGNVWVKTESIPSQKLVVDGFTEATKLAQFNVPSEVKKVHIDTIATNDLGNKVDTYETIRNQFQQWAGSQAELGQLTQDQMKAFVTSPLNEGGLGLSPALYENAYHFSSLNYGFGDNNDWSLFLGNKLGSFGETSILACIFGALFLIWTGIGSWRVMVGMGLELSSPR